MKNKRMKPLYENTDFLKQKVNNENTKLCPTCKERHLTELLQMNNVPYVYIECTNNKDLFFGRFMRYDKLQNIVFGHVDKIVNPDYFELIHLDRKIKSLKNL